MANPEGSRTTLIVLGIVGGVVLLVAACCGGAYFLVPQEARDMATQMVQMGQQMQRGIQALDTGFADEFGDDARWEIGGSGTEGIFLLGVGPDVELDDAKVVELQDAAWRRYCEAFSGGGLPVRSVGIGYAGKRTGGPNSHQGKVSGWTTHVADAATMEGRTGVAAPPASEFIQSVEALQERHAGVDVRITTGDDATDEPEPAEKAPAPDGD